MDPRPNDVPVEPAETGVEPRQAQAGQAESNALVEVRSQATYAEYPLSDAVGGMGEYGVRGQSAMMLLYASVRRLERDLKDLKEELVKERAQNDRLRSQVADSDQRVAVLTERLSAARQLRMLRNVLTTLGGLVAGVAAPTWPVLVLRTRLRLRS